MALECPLFVATPLSNVIDVTLIFLDSPVIVEGKILLTDLVPLLLMDFDVILEMHWL